MRPITQVVSQSFNKRKSWLIMGREVFSCPIEPQSPEISRKIADAASLQIVLIIFLQKLALPLGSGQVQFILILHYAFIFYALYIGWARISILRTIIYMSLIFISTFNHVFFQPYEFSIGSFVFFIVLYFPFLFFLQISQQDYNLILKKITKYGIIISFFVFFDWITQILNLGMLNIENFIPKQILLEQYYYIQPLYYGSKFTKPNGIFFLETSFVSQYISLALIVELCLFQRMNYILIMLSGLLATFGGTGLSTLMLTVPFILFHLRPILIVGLVVVSPLMILIADQIGLTSNIEKRIGTFDQQGTSANYRFIAPIYTIYDGWRGSIQTTLFGIGAGNMPRGDNVTWNPISKIFKEYGLLFTLVFFYFTAIICFGRGIYFIIGWTIFIQYHLMNASLLVPLEAIYLFMIPGAYSIYGRSDKKSEPSGCAQKT